MNNDIRELAQRKPTFFQTLRAVAWGFFGVRKGKGYTDDIGSLNPVHLIIAGVLGAIVFVILLVAAARWLIGTVA